MGSLDDVWDEAEPTESSGALDDVWDEAEPIEPIKSNDDYEYGRVGRIADVTGKSIAQGVSRFGEGLGAVLDTGEDLLAGDDNYNGYGRDIINYFRPYVQANEQYLKDEVDPESWEGTYSNVTSGVSSFLPTLPFLGGVPSAIISGIISRYGQKVNDIERAGGENPKSGGAVSAIAGAPIDAVQFAPIFNKALTPFRKTVESAITSAIGSAAELPFSMYSDFVGGSREVEPTKDEIMAAVPNALIEGGFTGATIATTYSAIDSRIQSGKTKAMKDKTAEYAAKIDEVQKAQAVQDMTARANAEMRTDTPVGDLPSVQDQAAALNPESPRVFDKEAAVKFANDQAATKMGATEPLAPPADVISKQPELPAVEQAPIVTHTGDAVAEQVDFMKPSEPMRIKPELIELSEDVPNFKKGSNERGVVNEIKGDLDPRESAPISVWQRADGRLEVISGRHRLDIHKRKNAPFINAEVYREADGFTAEMARILDAELNIRDDKGSTQDFSKYFKYRNISEEQATQRSLMNSAKGKDGYVIGTKASDEVFALHQAEKLTDKQASAIAEAAPNSPDVQRAGVNAALFKGSTPDELRNITRLAGLGPTRTDVQGDMFGANDTALNNAVAVSRLASQKSKNIGQEISAVQNAAKNPEIAKKYDIDIKDPENILLKVAQLKVEKARWDDFAKFPDLIQALQRELNLGGGQQLQLSKDPDVAAYKMGENLSVDPESGQLQFDNSSGVFPKTVKKPDNQGSDFTGDSMPLLDGIAKAKSNQSNINDTQGSETILNSNELKQKVGKKKANIATKLESQKGAIKVDLPNPFNFTGFKDVVNRMKGSGYQANPEYYQFFKNKRNLLTSELNKADKFPWYRKSHEAAIKNFERENSMAWDHAESIRPFALLNEKEKLNVTSLAYELNRRGADFKSTPENLKALGMTDREILGYGAVRNTMDRSLEMMRTEALTKLAEKPVVASPDNMKRVGFKPAEIQKIIMSVKDSAQLEGLIRSKETEQINQHFDRLKETNYVPTGRYGKFGLTLMNKQGEMSEFIMSDSKGKLLQTMYDKLRADPDLDITKSRVAPVPRPKSSEYVGAHPDIIDVMGDSGGHIPSTSFLNRLKRRQLLEGYEVDLQRNLASYLSSHSRYLAGQETKRQFSKLNKEFDSFYETLGARDKTLYSELRGNIGKLQNYVMTPSPSMGAMSKFFATYYLANNVKTTLVNTTSFLNTLPNAARYMGIKGGLTPAPEIAFMKSMGQTVNYYRKKMTGDTKGEVGKDLYASLEEARKEGVVGGNRVVKDLLQDVNNPDAKSALGQKISNQDALFFLNMVTEDFVRTQGYIMGWNIYDKADPYYKKIGQEKPNRHEFAKRFVREVHADYTKAGIPDIAKNPVGKLGSTFRLWHHGFFRMLKNSVMEKNIGAVGRFAGILGTLGGVYAIPAVKDVLKSLKQAGYDPDKEIKEFTPWEDPGYENMFLKGILANPKGANMDISAAISPDTIPQNANEGDPISALGRAFLGVVADPIDRVSKANYYFNEKGDVPRALEQFLPRAFNMQDIVAGRRWKREGVRDSNNVNILKDDEGNDRMPSDYEVGIKSIGINPATVSNAYDRKQAVGKIKDDLDNENINHKIALKIYRGEDFQPMLRDAADRGLLGSKWKESVKEQVKKMQSSKYAERKFVTDKGLTALEAVNEEYKGLLSE